MSALLLKKRRLVAKTVRDLSREFLSAELTHEDLDVALAGLESVRQSFARATRYVRDDDGFLVDSAGTVHSEEFSWDMDPLVGVSNPLSPPVIEKDRQTATWSVTFSDAYEGHPGLAHGGYVAATLDHVLGVTASEAEGTSMTGTLAVRYCKPTPTNVELLCRGEIDRVEGRKVFCRAVLLAGSETVAEADGIFFRVDTPTPRGV